MPRGKVQIDALSAILSNAYNHIHFVFLPTSTDELLRVFATSYPH
jgi:hypothetical protein